MEIYVRSFVPPSPQTSGDKPVGQWQVSTAGGVHAIWRPDGRELYYLDPAGGMKAAPITVTGSMLEPGAPVLLFPTRIVGGGGDNQQTRQYDVPPTGASSSARNESAAAPITLVMNWQADAKK
jgi:hypothetical protein